MSGTVIANAEPSSGVVKKVWAATGGTAIGGALAALVIWLLDTNHVLSKEALPANVTDAISTLISSLAALGLGYYARPGHDEVAVMDASGQPRTGAIRGAVAAVPGALAGTAGGTAD